MKKTKKIKSKEENLEKIPVNKITEKWMPSGYLFGIFGEEADELSILLEYCERYTIDKGSKKIKNFLIVIVSRLFRNKDCRNIINIVEIHDLVCEKYPIYIESISKCFNFIDKSYFNDFFHSFIEEEYFKSRTAKFFL